MPIISNGFAWSMAGKEAGLQVVNGICGLGHAKVLAPVSNLDQGIDWPVTSLINLEEPMLQYYPSCAQAGVQFGSHLHGFKPGVAVKKKTYGNKNLLCDFWN